MKLFPKSNKRIIISDKIDHIPESKTGMYIPKCNWPYSEDGDFNRRDSEAAWKKIL